MNDIIKPVNDSKNFIKALKSATDNFFGIKITLTDNEIKDIIKVIKSLENREILLKGTTRKCTSQGGFLSFVRPLMTAGLPLMKSTYTIGQLCFVTFGFSAEMSAADSVVQKKICGSGTTTLIILNYEMKGIRKIGK